MFLVNKDDDIDDIINVIEIPCVIKPVNGGSSVGVTIARNNLDDSRDMSSGNS